MSDSTVLIRPDFMSRTLEDLEEKFQEEVDNVDMAFRDEPDYIHMRYIMVLGTDTVWDKYAHNFMKAAHLRLAAPNSYPIWHKSPSREIIDAEKIVFDPTNSLPAGYINRFTGFDLKPAKGDVTKLIYHLATLCGDKLDVFDWVLKWVAYPLQNPGAKMTTALVFYSAREGTGKNIFFDAVKNIYGKWGTTIGQSQLDSDFNGWMYRRLFCIANEVTGGGKDKGRMKRKMRMLIADSTTQINDKGDKVFEDGNFCNFVLMGNELDTADVDIFDRRLMIVNCEDIFPLSYFEDLFNSIDLPALYDYLMHVDLTGFGPHTKPLMTDAKKELMNFCARSEQRFITEWMAGETAYPVCNVPALSLYWAYRCWCEEQGEKTSATNTAFGRWATASGLKRERPSIYGSTKKITVYFVGDVLPSIKTGDYYEFERTLKLMGAKYPYKS